MALIPKNSAGITGLRVDNLYQAAAAGDTAPTGSGVVLLVKNTSGASVTVTLAYPQKYDGDQTVTGRAHTVAGTTGEFAIPMRDIYRSPTTGVASLTYSTTVGVTVCVVQVP